MRAARPDPFPPPNAPIPISRRREAEKAASDLLRQAGQARGLIDQAEQATVAALQQVQALKDAEAEAAASVADARALITQLTRGRK